MSLRNEFPTTQSNNESPSTQSNADYKVVFFNFANDLPWTHSATQAGEKYVSTHPDEHMHPPRMNKFHDPDDTATKALELWKNIIKPMTYTKMAFGTPEELNQHEHSTVEVPVTKEQFIKAQNLMDKQVQDGEQNKVHYSVVNTFGRSCAESAQQVLEVITDNTDEAPMAKRTFPERVIVWPNSLFERAQSVAHARKDNSEPIPPNNPARQNKPGLFAKTQPSPKVDTASTERFLEMERSAWF